MQNFEFYSPSKVIFGTGEFARLGEEVRNYGTSAILVKQEGPLEEMGVFKKAHQFMEEQGVEVTDLNGILSNPRLSKIEEGIRLAKQKEIQVIVAVGGGSSIDTAKAVAAGACDDGDLWDFFSGERAVGSTLPVVAVSTISATGAETSCHCVITNDRDKERKNWKKWAVHDSAVFPRTAIIDPQLLCTVPTNLTAAGMADAISHVLEGYFDGIPDNPLSDYIGEGIVKTIIENERVLDNPSDLQARAAVAWAALLAINGLQDCGRSNAGWPAHWIQHAVGALTDSSHGEGLAVINPAWMELDNREHPEKYMQFAERVFGIGRTDKMTDVEYGQAGIQALKNKYKQWGLPSCLNELGVTRGMLQKITDNVMKNNESYEFQPGKVKEVLESCLEKKGDVM